MGSPQLLRATPYPFSLPEWTVGGPSPDLVVNGGPQEGAHPAGAVGPLLAWGQHSIVLQLSVPGTTPGPPLALSQHTSLAITSPGTRFRAAHCPFQADSDPVAPASVPTSVSSRDSRPASFLPQHMCQPVGARSPEGGRFPPGPPSALTADLSHTQGLCVTPGAVVGGQMCLCVDVGAKQGGAARVRKT